MEYIPEELVIPRDMLEKFGCYDDVNVNVLMSDEDKENLEPLCKREDRRGLLGLGDTTSITVRIIMDSMLYQVLDGQETTPTIAMPSLL